MSWHKSVNNILALVSYELEITRDQFRNKEIFLREKTPPFIGLEFSFIEKEEKYYVKVAHKKVKDKSHLPPKEEIASEIDRLVNTLQTKKIRPVVIRICRSMISGYCLRDYYEFIETALKEKMRKLFEH
jgi:hypothetical protein